MRLNISDRVGFVLTVDVNVDGEAREFKARVSGKRCEPKELAAQFQAGATNADLVATCGLGIVAWEGDALFVDDADQPLVGDAGLRALLDFSPTAWEPTVTGYLEANSPKARLGN
jgi:hypothetical protein